MWSIFVPVLYHFWATFGQYIKIWIITWPYAVQFCTNLVPLLSTNIKELCVVHIWYIFVPVSYQFWPKTEFWIRKYYKIGTVGQDSRLSVPLSAQLWASFDQNWVKIVPTLGRKWYSMHGICERILWEILRGFVRIGQHKDCSTLVFLCWPTATTPRARVDTRPLANRFPIKSLRLKSVYFMQ